MGMQRMLVIDQIRRDCGSPSENQCGCGAHTDNKNWQIVARELPDGISSVFLTDCKVAIICPASLNGWIELFIAMRDTVSIPAGES